MKHRRVANERTEEVATPVVSEKTPDTQTLAHDYRFIVITVIAVTLISHSFVVVIDIVVVVVDIAVIDIVVVVVVLVLVTPR